VIEAFFNEQANYTVRVEDELSTLCLDIPDDSEERLELRSLAQSV
jgi:hypothetical protein